MIMSELSNMQRGKIIGAHFPGASMSRTTNLVGVSRTTMSRVMTVYTNLGKVSSAKHSSGQNLKVCDRWLLKMIVT